MLPPFRWSCQLSEVRCIINWMTCSFVMTILESSSTIFDLQIVVDEIHEIRDLGTCNIEYFVLSTELGHYNSNRLFVQCKDLPSQKNKGIMRTVDILFVTNMGMTCYNWHHVPYHMIGGLPLLISFLWWVLWMVEFVFLRYICFCQGISSSSCSNICPKVNALFNAS